MVLIDKIPWITHGGPGTPLYSLSIHPSNSRIATSGSDHKVKIWSLSTALSAKADANKSSQKLLATLADHGGPVNVIRFSHNGRFLASGSDDRVVAVLELKGGLGQSSFGSSDVPNLENWKAVLSLRGHSAGIPDLSWSPDDDLLASCSLDNTVLIWDTSTGQLKHTLKAHTSFVKGSAWDPMGRYFASQSDDRSVIIWDRNTWAPVKHITDPFSKGFMSATFSLRIDWSPDGTSLACANSFQAPCHICPLVQRGTWLTGKQNLVGHSKAVVVAAFNPKLFYKDADVASACIALGSQDSRLSVWVLHKERPIFIAARFFERSVIDLAWTPDGYTLFASSMDGTVAQFSFEEKELGKAVSEDEFEKLKEQLHGAYAPSTLRFAENAEQQHMDIENGADLQNSSSLIASNSQALAGRLARDNGQPSSLPIMHTQAARVQPAPVRAPAQAQKPSAPAPQFPPPRPVPSSLAGSKRKLAEAPQPAASKRRITPESTHTQPGAPAPSTAAAASSSQQTPSRAAAGDSATATSTSSIVFEQEASLHVELGREALPLGDQAEAGSRVLEAVQQGRQWRLLCHSGTARQWSDDVPGRITAVAGSLHFSAAGFQSGALQVYTPAGRRLFPAIQLNAPVVALCSDQAWRLLAVCQDGSLQLWDLQRLTSLLTTPLQPLLAQAPSGTAVRHVQLSRQGVPQVLLSNRSAWLWHLDLRCWMCLADPAFAASPFTSLLPLNTAQGDLSRIQQQAGSSGRGLAPGALLGVGLGSRGGLGQGRAHLEANMAAALALQSPHEYKRWLGTYASHLSGEGDDVRLKELCLELLGRDRDSLDPLQQGRGQTASIFGLSKSQLLQNEVLRRSSDKHQNIRRLKAEISDLMSGMQ